MEKLYKGYVLTKNKKCLQRFKDVINLPTLDDVKNNSEYAGVLADGIVLIDFDDTHQANIALKIIRDNDLRCHVVKTKRGIHAYFKANDKMTTCKTNTKLACGLSADIKLGSRNSYSILKYENQEREVLLTSNEIQEVPMFLTPIKSNVELLGLSEGMGRNQTLFNYILTLQSNGFTVDQSRECLQIINDYVLGVRMSQNELDVIMREDSFQKPIFFSGKTFLFDKFANFIKNNAHIVKIDNQLHIYDDGIYVEGRDKIESEMIRHIPNLNRAKRTEVLDYLNILIRDNATVSTANYIAFKNGIYNVVKDELVPFSEKFIITNKINFNYNPNAHSELIESTLDKLSCGDDTIRSLLEEAIGYCFYRRNELGKSFMLTGNKSNGKSTFLDMVKTLLGDENISSLDLSELSEKFQNAELFGKLANIGDDIGDEFIGNSAIFKKLVTGDRIQVQRKGERPFEFNNYAKLLFSANDIPRIKDRTGAVQRRLIIIPFNATFSKDDPDYRPYIKYELREPENIEYLILLGIRGLKRVLENQEFSESESVLKELEEYEESNNPIIGFFKENVDIAVENQSTNSVYMRYNEYCLANNCQPMSKIEFSKQVKKRFNMDTKPKTVDGKVQRVFVRK